MTTTLHITYRGVPLTLECVGDHDDFEINRVLHAGTDISDLFDDWFELDACAHALVRQQREDAAEERALAYADDLAYEHRLAA